MFNKEESLRLNSEPPIVLKVSAMTDFLWPSFVRETKPRVKYLADRFDIRQLSRFAKELFEFLYMGGEVEPLVSLDDAEEYFRARQNGDDAQYPANYKPENALWHLILNDVVNSPVYPAMQRHCLGDQFNAGNNAVNILNELAAVIHQMIDENEELCHKLGEDGVELEQIRAQFVQAMQEGDTQTAAELKAKGKQLGERIEETLMNLHQGKRPEIDHSIEEAHNDAVDKSDQISKVAGSHAGFGSKVDDINDKLKLARKLSSSNSLQLFIDRLGAMKAAWTQRKRERPVKANYNNIVGAHFSDQVTKAFPSEVALAATEEGRALFALKYSQKTMLCKDYEANSKHVQQGPVVMYIDISGSMHGRDSVWSKALAYCVSEECVNNNRDVHIRLFNASVDKTIDIHSGNKDNEELLEFMMRWQTNGGTSFNSVMADAFNLNKELRKADILIITDGECEVEDRIVRKFNQFKDDNKIDVRGFCIGRKSESLSKFCDEVVNVNPIDDTDTADLFQSAIS
tara:strand:- start:511 stop:2052 length:1542 start_codon:yes stop_codon:yes gene_type:complete